ncbi:MAG: hypothetical protein AAF497_01150 [Planctomycetota bacterium]
MNGVELASGRDIVDFQLDATGTYYLAVSATNGATGPYLFDIAIGEVIFDPTDDHVDELGPEATVIGLVPNGGQLTGSSLGIIEEPGDVDFFQFTIDTDASSLVSTFSFEFVGLELSLYAEDGTLLDSATTSDPFANTQLTGDLEAGTYYLSVAGLEESTGLYIVDVLIGESEPQVDDHVDEIGPDATEITLVDDGTRLQGNGDGVIQAGGDIDVFQFTVDTDGPVEITTFPIGPGLEISLLDSSGNQLDSVVAEGVFQPVILSQDITAGTYYISVSAIDPATSTFFQFNVAFGEVVIEDDHVDVIGPDATEILFDDAGADGLQIGFATGFLDHDDDVDVFQFDVAVNSTAHIQALPFLFTSATFAVADGDGNILAEGTSTMFFGEVAFDLDLDAGTYYLVVSSDDGGFGDYFVNVTLGERATTKDVDHQAWISSELPIL